MKIIPVILCGGSGTRLWPLSRESYPKQLLALDGELTLLQQTVMRTTGLKDVEPPVLICNEKHRFLVAEQLRQISIVGQIVLEPAAMNTAPAAALAASICDPEDILLIFPSDHIVRDLANFERAADSAVALAKLEYLVTFGVKPTHPETGYGYIRRGLPIEGGMAYLIDDFVEKPNVVKAMDYQKSGDYLWNSGMFAFKAKSFLEELALHQPLIESAVRQSVDLGNHDVDFYRPDIDTFLTIPPNSIDYAIMEKTDRAAVVSLDAGWSDVGSWEAVWGVAEKDENQNLIRGDVLLDEVEGSYIHSEHRLVAVAGMKDVVVVETSDAILVSTREYSQKVRNLVNKMKDGNREERLSHRKVYRPWGYYESLDVGLRFQVKRICVNPGGVLSLQKHHHRAEHWVVVRGTGRVVKDDETFLLQENESTFIPLGSKHRLENPGNTLLEIVEVQTGEYLGEDDIVRFEDHYGRV